MLTELATNKPIEIFYKTAQGSDLEPGWMPYVWDLIVLILSMPDNDFKANDIWYRLQSEQQMIDKYNGTSKCLQYIEDVRGLSRCPR
jgi:hypothetical protein